MKNKKIQIFYSFLVLLILNGCKTLNTNLSINEKKIPKTYSVLHTDSNALAQMEWRQFFADTLLVKLIDTALAGNIDLQLALQRIESARADVKMSSGAILPQVGINVNGGVRRFGLYTMDGAGNITTEITPGQIVPINLPDMYTGLNASWEIDIWGKLRSKRKSAVATYLSSIEGTNFVISNLIGDVAISYFELLALDRELDYIGETIKKQQKALEVVSIQKETGRATELAIQQFEAQLLNSRVLEIEIKQQIIERENLINFLLGRYPQSIQRNTEALFQDVPSNLALGIPSQLLANRPDIREAEFQLKASMFDLKAAKSAFYPNINITAALGFQAFNPKFLFLTPSSVAYTALGGIFAPVLNMSSLKAQFNTAKSNQLTAMYNYQKTILNGFVEVMNELSNIENLERVNLLRKKQSEALAKSVELSNELFIASKASYLEVLLAQQNSLQAQLELIDLNKRQKIAMVNIYKALGGGWR